LYVVAITDRALMRFSSSGRQYETVRCGRLFLVGERCSRPPSRTDAELARQHAVVRHVGELTEALLPTRFGTYAPDADLRAAVRRNHDVLAAALEEVRGRAQMTIRVLAPAAVPAAEPTTSGRAYLERRRRQLVPPLPASVVRYLSRLRPFVIREQRGPSIGRLRATIHHLVDRTSLPAYQKIADSRRPSSVVTTGPWPPFAFTPRLL
jgi:hypothetical protein